MKDPEKVVARAQRAAEILSDPLLIEAKAHIEAELWRQFQAAAPSDAAALGFIKGMQYLHSKYFAFLGSVVNDGKLAALDIERKKPTVKERLFGR